MPASSLLHRVTAPSPISALTSSGRPSLVIQTSFLGDAILTTPLLTELAARGPVDIVTTPAAATVLAHHPAIRSVIVYDKRRDARGLTGLWRTARALNARYTTPTRGAGREMPIAYLAQGSIRSGLLAILAGCHERIGFSTSTARALYTRTIPYQRDQHHAERLWRLAAASPEAEPPAAIRPTLYPGEADVRAVDELLGAGPAGRGLVALAPGSAWGAKRWPYYPELGAALSAANQVIVVGGLTDRALAAEIGAAVGATGHSVIDATGCLTLLGTAELIRRCAVLVCNDSAPQHLASAMGTPTVAIFGPTSPDFGFGPLAPRHAVVGVDGLPCRPCDAHGPQRCPLGHWRCMREITAAEVAAFVDRVGGLPQA
jgi:heptosyltransferase-2